MRTTCSASSGFTLVELVIFTMILGIIAGSILLAFNTTLRYTPTTLKQITATQTAAKCMEWYLGQRYLNGFSSVATCPSTTVPAFCTAPTGYTLSTTVSCSSIGSDTNYRQVTVTVGGQANASLSLLLANY